MSGTTRSVLIPSDPAYRSSLDYEGGAAQGRDPGDVVSFYVRLPLSFEVALPIAISLLFFKSCPIYLGSSVILNPFLFQC